MTAKNVDKEDKSFWAKYGTVVGVIVFIAVSVIVAYAWWFYPTRILPHLADFTSETTSATKAEFGDSYGALNTLFSGAAFAILIFTMFMQGRELSLQRQELKEARAVAKDQADTMALQRFENTFFQMLDLYEGAFEKVQTETENGIVFAKEAFFEIEGDLSASCNFDKIGVNREKLPDVRYGDVFFDRDWHLTEYFQVLYQLFTLIDKSNVGDEFFYTRNIRSLMSDCEVSVLFCACLSIDMAKTLKPLLEKYSFWEGLRFVKYAPVRAEYIQMYDKSAYGGTYPEASD